MFKSNHRPPSHHLPVYPIHSLVCDNLWYIICMSWIQPPFHPHPAPTPNSSPWKLAVVAVICSLLKRSIPKAPGTRILKFKMPVNTQWSTFQNGCCFFYCIYKASPTMRPSQHSKKTLRSHTLKNELHPKVLQVSERDCPYLADFLWSTIGAVGDWGIVGCGVQRASGRLGLGLVGLFQRQCNCWTHKNKRYVSKVSKVRRIMNVTNVSLM